jgi:hypothetical protein
MEKKIIEKITRFLELSSQFSKEEEDLFEKELLNKVKYQHNNITLSNYTISSGVIYSATEIKTLTLSETIEQESEKLLLLDKEFSEFKKLRAELKTYFEALTKITK